MYNHHIWGKPKNVVSLVVFKKDMLPACRYDLPTYVHKMGCNFTFSHQDTIRNHHYPPPPPSLPRLC